MLFADFLSQQDHALGHFPSKGPLQPPEHEEQFHIFEDLTGPLFEFFLEQHG